MGSIKGGAQQAVVDYSMSMHYGVAISADTLNGIYAQAKTVWEGNVSVNATIDINNPDLFGGAKAQGGMVGQAHVLFGGPAQIAPAALAGRLTIASVALTPETCPAFRGLLTVLFCSDAGGGFHFQYNSPQIPPLSFKLWRDPRAGALNPAYSRIEARGAAANRLVSAGFNDALTDPTTGAPITIVGDGPTYGPTIPDANPAHIIYELLTNSDWGMGTSPDDIEISTFDAAAATLFTEKLGMSIIWTSQQTIDALVTQILGTIQGAIYTRPSTGKFELKLFRQDYWIVQPTGTLFASAGDINPANATITSFSRKLHGELANEVVVDWTNPLTEQTESITIQDPGAIANANGIVSQRSSYPGVRNEILAVELGMRDLRSIGAPLGVIEVTLDRSFWNTVPGDIVTVTYPEYGLDGLICRIAKIDYGKPGEAVMKVNLMEDIFGSGVDSYIVAPPPIWEDPKRDPRPVTEVMPLTLPMFMLFNLGDGGVAAGREFSEVTVGMLAAPPATGLTAFELVGETVDSLGNVTDADLGTKNFMTHGVSSTPLLREARTASFIVGALVGYGTARVGAFLVMSTDTADQTDRAMEIMVITSVNTALGMVLLERGLFDTVPQAWPAGTPFYLTNAGRIDDPIGRASGTALDYKLLTIAGNGRLNASLAPIVEFTPTQRPFLPNRPGNIIAAGSRFNAIDWATVDDIPLSWANRNRLTEQSRIVLWDDADLPPESGQTTSLIIWPESLTAPITTIDDLPGTSYDLPVSAFSGASSGWIQFMAKRDGLPSLQGLLIHVGLSGTSVDLAGYGYDYGNDYGGVGPGGGGGGGGGGTDWIAIPNDTAVTIGGLTWTTLNADTGHSLLHSASLGIYRFEVRDGERYQHPGLFVDAAYVMRSEVNGPTFALNTVATFTWGVLLTGVPNPTTNAWLIIGQVHADDHVSGASPIFSVNVLPDGSGGENAIFDVNYNTGSGNVFTTMGSIPFSRGVHYVFSVDIIDAKGSTGYIRVKVNGVVVATWTGITGYSTATMGGHPKFGIYTGGHGLVATDMPDPGQDFIADYDNISFSAVAVVADAFYISPSGSDSNIGTKAAPFLTTTKAKNSFTSTRRTAYFMAGTHNVSAWPQASDTTWRRDPTAAPGTVIVHLIGANFGGSAVNNVTIQNLKITQTGTGPKFLFDAGCVNLHILGNDVTDVGYQNFLQIYNPGDGLCIQGNKGVSDTWSAAQEALVPGSGGIFPFNTICNTPANHDNWKITDNDWVGGTFPYQAQTQGTPGIYTNIHADRNRFVGWGDAASTVGCIGMSHVLSYNAANHDNTCCDNYLEASPTAAFGHGTGVEAAMAGCTYRNTIIAGQGYAVAKCPGSLYDGSVFTLSGGLNMAFTHDGIGVGGQFYDGVNVEVRSNTRNGVTFSGIGTPTNVTDAGPAPSATGLPTYTPSSPYVPS